ncbi:Uncharacterised protein [uncultured archaeon]|nr:Uncharacterised protein [uncultured archaeon]
MVLAIAFLLAPAMAQEAMGGQGVDILKNGIFQTDGSAFTFPVYLQDTNYGSVQVGNDKATAFGTGNSFPFGFRNGPADAQNNLEIKKNQDSGARLDPDGYVIDAYNNSYNKLNIDQIKVGNRDALAFGYATANNNVKILTNQQ